MYIFVVDMQPLCHFLVGKGVEQRLSFDYLIAPDTI
jgi:hypothetical protein